MFSSDDWGQTSAEHGLADPENLSHVRNTQYSRRVAAVMLVQQGILESELQLRVAFLALTVSNSPSLRLRCPISKILISELSVMPNLNRFTG